MSLEWILDYYFNGKTYHKWYYLYNRSPLIKDLYNYLLNFKNDFFIKSQETLEKCCYINSLSDMLSPFEQLLYITPFDKNLGYINMFNEYSDQNKVKEVIVTLFKDYKDLHENAEEHQVNSSQDIIEASFHGTNCWNYHWGGYLVVGDGAQRQAGVS